MSREDGEIGFQLLDEDLRVAARLWEKANRQTVRMIDFSRGCMGRAHLHGCAMHRVAGMIFAKVDTSSPASREKPVKFGTDGTVLRAATLLVTEYWHSILYIF